MDNNTINPLYEKIIKARNGHYYHALEVEDVHELESIVESICEEEMENFGEEVLIDFFCSMGLYCLNDESEEEVYAFNFREYISTQ